MRLLDPVKVLDLYNCGQITLMELHLRLIQAAATDPPQEIVPLLPEKLLHVIRELSATPPTALEGSPRIFWMGATLVDEQEARRLWYDGVWRWHHYFEGPTLGFESPPQIECKEFPRRV